MADSHKDKKVADSVAANAGAATTQRRGYSADPTRPAQRVQLIFNLRNGVALPLRHVHHRHGEWREVDAGDDG